MDAAHRLAMRDIIKRARAAARKAAKKASA